MSNWQEYSIYNKIVDILKTVQYGDHHFGRPFVSAYQLAIAFDSKHSAVVTALGIEIGGAGTGSHVSLSQYLARELSQRIKSGEITDIEGSFLSNLHLEDILFEVHSGSDPVRSSLTNSGYPLSLFRCKD